MPVYKHIVQVHPVEKGEPNLKLVYGEHGFETKEDAQCWMNNFNKLEVEFGREDILAFYARLKLKE